MTTLDFVETAGDDGVLRLQVPVGEAGKRYHVVLHVEPEGAPAAQLLDDWPPGFFERTYGAWKGELERASQGDFEERAPF